jgi:hypothetical protein
MGDIPMIPWEMPMKCGIATLPAYSPIYWVELAASISPSLMIIYCHVWMQNIQKSLHPLNHLTSPQTKFYYRVLSAKFEPGYLWTRGKHATNPAMLPVLFLLGIFVVERGLCNICEIAPFSFSTSQSKAATPSYLSKLFIDSPVCLLRKRRISIFYNLIQHSTLPCFLQIWRTLFCCNFKFYNFLNYILKFRLRSCTLLDVKLRTTKYLPYFVVGIIPLITPEKIEDTGST